jgi:hypothetical protein
VNFFRHRRHRIAAALLLLLLAAGGLARTGREPRFEGRTLSAWLEDSTLDEAESRRGVQGIGTNALPWLKKWLHQSPTLLERSLGWVERQQPYVIFNHHPAVTANLRGMRGFFHLEHLVAPAVPWLEAGAGRKDLDYFFHLKALALAGPPGWEALARLEQTATPQERVLIMNAVAFGLPRHPELIPRLGTFLEDADPMLRHRTIWLLKNLDTNCPPALLAALERRAEEEPDEGLRASARRAAGLISQSLRTTPHQPQPATPPR